MAIYILIIFSLIQVILARQSSFLTQSEGIVNPGPGYMEFFQDQPEDVLNQEIQLSSKIPAWLKGDLINSCPSIFEIGKYEFGSFIDGFMRFNKFSFDGKGSAFFSSKLIKDTNYYNTTQKEQCPMGFLSEYTVPKRWTDFVPGANMMNDKLHKNDNIGVQPYRLPDNKTYVFTTDVPTWLQFNKEDLTTQGVIDLRKADFGEMMLGTTHMHNDESTGDLIGLGVQMGKDNYAAFYRIKAENITKPVLIGKIPLRGPCWFHSYGITSDYLLLPEHPVTFNFVKMALGYPISLSYERDHTKNTRLHLMKIGGEDEGKFQTFELDHNNQIFHYGNMYQDGDVLVFTVEMYDVSANPFKVLNVQYATQDNSGVFIGSKYRRYMLNIKTGETTYQDMIIEDRDSVGFPMVNPNFHGKKNCFSYITHISHSSYSTAILKVDHCNNDQITEFRQDNLYIQEPHFVPNPNGTQEEDGLIVITAYDGNIQKNKLMIIDPKTMELVEDHELKIRLSFGLHYQFFFDE